MMPTLPTKAPGLAVRFARPLCAALVVLGVSSLRAQTWQGTGNNWSTAANWSSTLANDGSASVLFSSGGNITSTVDATWSISGLNFSSSAQNFTLGGTSTLTIGAGGLTSNSTSASQTITAPVAIGATMTGNITTGSSVALNGALSGSGNLTKMGGGTLSLGNTTSTYSGTITLTEGTLALTTNFPGAAPVTLNGGTLAFVNSSTIGGSHPMAVQAASTVNVASGTGFLNAALTGTASLTKTGAGTLSLPSGAQNYAGTYIINEGNVTTGTAVALKNTTVVLNGGALPLTANNPTLGGLSSSLSGSTLSLSNNGVSTTFSIGNNSQSTTFAGTLTGFNLTKIGNGTLTLSNSANSYTGTTIVNGGTLMITGGLTATSSVTVNNGGTLAGTGSITGTTTATSIASGGIIAPGNASVGTLTFAPTGAGNFTLNTGSILAIDIGATSDKIVFSSGRINGPTGTGGVTVNFATAGGFAGAGTYTLIDYTGATNFGLDAADFAVGTALSGYSASFGLNGSLLQVTLSAVPEPSTYAAWAGLATLGLAAYRRRSRRPAR